MLCMPACLTEHKHDPFLGRCAVTYIFTLHASSPEHASGVHQPHQGITMYKLIVTAVVFLGSFTVRAGNEGAMLKIDYSKKPAWNYAITYHSECVFVEKKVTSAKKTDITCDFLATVSENKDRMTVGIRNLSATSDLYDDTTRASVIEKISGTSYSMGLINGFPAIDTVIDLSPGGIPEWNLYLQFAKLLPEMPDQPVKKGYSWERTALLPIKSAQGKVNCEMFRLFKIDRLSPKNDTAYISWQFRYAAPEQAVDTSSLLQFVPLAGNGKGTAVLDVLNGFVVRAEVEFTTPVVVMDKLKVNWVEKASLAIKPAKK
jgi:hypothetical protein